MASALNTKINSYALERGIEFSEAYSLTPTRTGSNALGTFIFSNSPEPTYESTVNPVGGSGSWKFVSKQSGSPRFRTTSTNEWSGVDDRDYTQGFWFSASQIPTLTSSGTTATAVLIYAMLPLTGIGWNVGLAPSNTTATQDGQSLANKILISVVGGVYVIGPTLQPNKWYYVAVRKIGDTVQVYLDGSLLQSLTNTTIASATSISYGAISNPPTTSETNFWISNFHQSTSSILNATAIEEIWAVGSSINKTIIETPATASALMTEPTIIVQTGNNTQITTSILVSAEFPSNVSIVAQANVNVTVTEILEASTQLINNVTINTGTDESFSALEFTASAEFVEPILPQRPMTASALMGNHIASVTPSYFALIKNLNPYLYVNNGQTAANIVNHGYQAVTFTKGTGLSTLQDAGNPLNLIGEGKSWKGSDNSGDADWLRITAPSTAESFDNILGTGEFSIEFWTKTPSWFQITASPTKTDFIRDPSLYFYYLNSETEYASVLPAKFGITIKNGPTSEQSILVSSSSFQQVPNNTYHYVLRSTKISSTTALIEVLRNGTVLLSQNIPFTNWTSDKTTNYIIGGIIGSEGYSPYYFDEVALYDFRLNNSQVINHFEFGNNLSPNSTNYSDVLTAYSESGDHAFVVTSNANGIATPITGSALFVDPAVLAVKNINFSATALTASATNTDVTVYYGWTIYATPAIASAEMGPAYFLSSYYYQYIQSNFAPYRYVTFDSSAPYLDYGSDIDYSVANVVVNGTVVNPDFGINGKSVKSTGTYTNGAAILKESEHNDNWGTGNASWHSSFWMRRALDDTSTGLRVLWNVNGYADNQYVIIYHYQNKLHVQINSQNDSPITMTTANNINIFDFERHHIVLNSHHNNNQNILTLYVDGVQVATQNIGTYAVTTINGAPHVGPNDEANNLPRLGIGTLITPFASTALPVVPSNISVYFDEIYWDKNQITLTDVVNQFNAMPDQNNETIVAEPFIASAQSVMPAISTQAILSIDSATASAEFVNPTLYIERFIINTANAMTASALMTEAITFVPVQINADVMVVTAIFNNAGAIITIPGQTMYATALLKSEALNIKLTTEIDGFIRTDTLYPNTLMTPWLAYLRATETTTILPMREVS